MFRILEISWFLISFLVLTFNKKDLEDYVEILEDSFCNLDIIIMQASQMIEQTSPAEDSSVKKKSCRFLGSKKSPKTETVTANNDTGEDYEQIEANDRSWCKWSPTSMSLLQAAEKQILSYVKTPFKGQYVNIGPSVGKEDCKVWTISLNENSSDKTPLVLVHGFASGVALWSLNLDELATSRPVYAFDILGFGKSSRPSFSSDAKEAETELVESFEKWRKEMKLERFVLLGHSMGGFLVSSYAIRYPERVSHLILADPWGFPIKPADPFAGRPIPMWVKMLAYLLEPLNPLWSIRAAGPMGPRLIQRARPDLIKKFSTLGEDINDTIADYIYHCNAQTPSGESAFHSMMNSFAWAKYPMIERIPSLNKNVPMTMIYGSTSWVDRGPGEVIQQLRPDSYVDVQIIQGAGHHVYADVRDEFRRIVHKAASHADENDVRRFSMENPVKPDNTSL